MELKSERTLTQFGSIQAGAERSAVLLESCWELWCTYGGRAAEAQQSGRPNQKGGPTKSAWKFEVLMP